MSCNVAADLRNTKYFYSVQGIAKMIAVNPTEVFDDDLFVGQTFASVRRAHPRLYQSISSNCETSNTWRRFRDYCRYVNLEELPPNVIAKFKASGSFAELPWHLEPKHTCVRALSSPSLPESASSMVPSQVRGSASSSGAAGSASTASMFSSQASGSTSSGAAGSACTSKKHNKPFHKSVSLAWRFNEAARYSCSECFSEAFALEAATGNMQCLGCRRFEERPRKWCQ